MNNQLLEIRERAAHYLGEMRIADGEAKINQLLIDLSETDEQDLDLKSKILDNIHNYLSIKSKLRISNSDLADLQEFASNLRLNYSKTLSELTKENSAQLERLLDIIKRNY